MEIELQPLRITTGWFIEWNTLLEVGPTESPRGVNYGPSGAWILLATHKQRRRAIDVSWLSGEPGLDVGCYQMQVLPMTEDNPDGEGESPADDGLFVRWGFPIETLCTASRIELVERLEAWFFEDQPTCTECEEFQGDEPSGR